MLSRARSQNRICVKSAVLMPFVLSAGLHFSDGRRAIAGAKERLGGCAERSRGIGRSGVYREQVKEVA